MRIFIWGCGFAAHELIERELSGIKISLFIDKNKKTFLEQKVYSPEEAVGMQYDAIIVASAFAGEIYQQAKELGYDLAKFIFVYNNYFFQDMNTDYRLAEQIFSQQYVEIIKSRYHVIRGMVLDEEKKHTLLVKTRHEDMFADDYNRIRTFELLAEEIRRGNISGEVAELGVFKGDFAKYINAAFPEKSCYLFDTFEGFRSSEAEKERQAGNCGAAFVEWFKDTNIEQVLCRMPNREKIICRKGLFPESLNGLEENFAFVSIDVDFEQAIFDGLEYFYPRLNRGGYILIHDYNSATLKGVKKAVYEYEEKYGIYLAKVPIPDLNGTLVITK
ncbi:hypothetical protein D7V94_06665 [Parablautia intestinalis]|uniref:Methyltransferase n=1 Tax=Parablautia intestinalis TaxID=2320100 RepID=A0A3A9AM02_9FIRM|nr:TylF/MycF/NovP-related O-methyltransferase [Parablautia intestinalis]RKI92358.1 hypothetical protein D7V94_06665 [Parablautia intestinalis]